MAWLFADVPANIPTAVFGARASSRADSKLLAGADAWLEGVEASAASSLTALEDALVARVGFEAQAGDFAAVADAAGYETFVAVGESQSTAAALWAGDSSALVALRFPAKPKRAAGDKKRVPLRERMAAARGN